MKNINNKINKNLDECSGGKSAININKNYIENINLLIKQKII